MLHAEPMSPVVVADLRKRYRRSGPWVLDGISLALPAGSITQLRGSNGSGKSTLLRVLAGVTSPSSGRVERRSGPVGFVPERFPSDLRMTPRQYLGWLARIRGFGAEGARTTIDRAADRLGLARSALDQPMSDLSKGTTQKVALIQALLASPALLLLDEAWTGLDAAAQQALSELVLESRTQGSVVVFADHGDRAVGLRPDATYVVADGALVAASANMQPAVARPLVRVVLRRDPHRAPEPTELERQAGVGSVTATPDGLAILVSAAEVDALLRTALDAGWSVASVQPEGLA